MKNLLLPPLLWTVLALFVALFPFAEGVKAAPRVVVVTNDRGGSITDRIAQIAALRQTGARVEIRGRVCLSSCTLYLALPGTCISPTTTFGFHGPSYFGAPLPKAEFDKWTVLISRHYPAPLRQWYIDTARLRTSGHHMLSGQELLRFGIRRCRTVRSGRSKFSNFGN